jgi:hypothetical protein
MTIQELGSLGELVGGLAVIVSVLYLAVQIRQNTRQLEHSTEAARAEVELDNARLAAEFNAAVADSTDLASIWFRGLTDAEQLDATETGRFNFLMGSLFYRLEGLFRQHQRGFLAEESFRPWARLMSNLLTTPFVRTWWEARSHPFSESFVSYVDGLLDAEPDGAGGVR